MNSTMTSRNRVSETLLDVGAPLAAIATLATHYGVPVGSLDTVLAAVVAGAAVPVFRRFVGQPFLKACDVGPVSVTGLVFMAACNAGIGAFSAMLMLPSVA